MGGTHRLIKEKSNLLIYVVLLALFLIPIPGSAQDVKISAPVWEIGDEWLYQDSYRDNFEVRVVRIEGNLIVTESSRRSDFLGYDKNTLQLKYTIDQTGKRTKPIVPYVDFPLYIEKKWKQTFPSTSLANVNIIREYRCLSYEDIMIPAGKFKVAKIKFIQTSIGPGWSGRGEALMWYSPEVKNIVKLKYEKTGYWVGVQDTELISFRPQDKAISSAEIEKREVKEIPDKFSYLIEHGARMIRENEFEKVFNLIEEVPRSDFRIKVLENFAYLKGYLVTKNKEYGKKWQFYYKSMVYTGDKTATPILIDLLKDDDPYMRSFTARALGYLGDQRALEELNRVASQDNSSKVRSRAKWAYEQISIGGPTKEPVEED